VLDRTRLDTRDGTGTRIDCVESTGSDSGAPRSHLHIATDLVAKYPTRPDARQFRVPNIGFTVQKSAVDRASSSNSHLF